MNIDWRTKNEMGRHLVVFTGNIENEGKKHPFNLYYHPRGKSFNIEYVDALGKPNNDQYGKFRLTRQILKEFNEKYS